MRVRDILRLCDEVGPTTQWRPLPETPSTDPADPSVFRLTKAERQFAERAALRGTTLWRNGWPDFLTERDGKTVAVEVKKGDDRISADQGRMFAALEKIGLDTFVWNPMRPDALIPWRKYRAIGRRPLADVRDIHSSRAKRFSRLTAVQAARPLKPPGR